MPSKSIIKNLLIICSTVLICYFLSTKIDLVEIKNLLTEVSFLFCLKAGIVTFLAFLCIVLRWQKILEVVGVKESFLKCFTIVLGSWPISVVSPSRSGDFIRVMGLRKDHRISLVFGTVLSERLFDLFVLLLLSIMGGIIQKMYHIVLISAGALTCMLILIALIHFKKSVPVPESIREKVENAFISLKKLAVSPSGLVVVFGYTILKFIATFYLVQMLFAVVGAHVDIVFIATMFPIVVLIGLLPLTISGIGVREGALMVLFADVASQSQSVAAGLLYLFFGYMLIAFFGLFFMQKGLDV